jgi:isocitrate dehydrogenase kinase/phosphatase
MSISKLQQLSDAMDLTNQMQALAEKAQWEQIIQLDKQRQDLFSQNFPVEQCRCK